MFYLNPSKKVLKSVLGCAWKNGPKYSAQNLLISGQGHRAGLMLIRSSIILRPVHVKSSRNHYLQYIRSSHLLKTHQYYLSICPMTWNFIAFFSNLPKLYNIIIIFCRFEGVRGFYKGITANLLKNVPASAVTFVVYENVLKVFKLTRRKDWSNFHSSIFAWNLLSLLPLHVFISSPPIALSFSAPFLSSQQ